MTAKTQAKDVYLAGGSWTAKQTEPVVYHLAVVRLRPETAGPDRFKVITSTEFTFNALVGEGGAWPGSKAYKNELDRSRNWKGVGLWLDAELGSIDANKITVVETVCASHTPICPLGVGSRSDDICSRALGVTRFPSSTAKP